MVSKVHFWNVFVDGILSDYNKEKEFFKKTFDFEVLQTIITKNIY